MDSASHPSPDSAAAPPLQPSLSRRRFIHSSAAAGLVAGAAPSILRAQTPSDEIQVAVIGCGAQGNVLMESCLNIPGVRFRAFCDIWETWSLRNSSRKIKRYGHEVATYVDYREMLDNEPEVDAVLIATPDLWHADHTVACLEAGKQVYCEKMMADTVENARRMVRAANETGKLLQIGHQRRSNPRYVNLLNDLIKLRDDSSTDPVERRAVLGRITNVNAQWNRSKSSSEIKEPKATYAIDEAMLQQFGYKNMYEFVNWRWFRAYSAGPISDLGAHQIDIFNWFLDAAPSGVIASGGTDYYTNNEHYDNIMAVFDYNTAQGVVRAFYQVLTTTSANGFFERFMGDEGTVQISEDPSSNRVYREALAESWDGLVEEGLLNPAFLEDDPGVDYKVWEKPRTWNLPAKPWVRNTKAVALTDSRDSAKLDAYDLPTILDKPSHQPHLENFFAAVRANDKALLNCPAEEAFKTCVTVLRVNDAIAAQQRLAFAPEDFIG